MLSGVTCLLGLAGTASAQVVISQVYGGGGNSGSTYRQDFIELFNKGSSPVALAGMSVQYNSATGTTAWTVRPLVGTIPANGYFLIQESQGAGGTTDLPAPDMISNTLSTPPAIFMSGTAAKVALVSNTVALTGASGCAAGTVLDVVGYGTTANCFEGSGPTTAPSNVNSVQRATGGCQDTNNNLGDFTAAAAAPRNSTNTFTCPNDCDGNGIADTIDIANNPSRDCNTNAVLDSCEIAANPALDCNSNTIPDSCDTASNPSLDCNANSQIDSCEIAANPNLDCNSNSTLDSCDVVGNPALDCNSNGIIDCEDLRRGTLTDVNANSTPDACEGAVVAEVGVNGTVQPAPVGVRAAPNGDGNVNIEGVNFGTFSSYGALRWPLTGTSGSPAETAVADALNAQFPSGWDIDTVHLFLVQDNAGFTFNGMAEVVHTDNDAIVIAPGTLTTVYDNYLTDYTDTQQVLAYAFTQGNINADGDGTITFHKIYDAAGPNSSGMAAVGAELETGTGSLTLLVHEIDAFVAATYAGRTNSNIKGPFRGPSLVVFAHATSTCGSADFDGDGDTGTDLDIEAFFACLGGDCCGTCGSADFDGDGDTGTDLDIEAFFRVLGGGEC